MEASGTLGGNLAVSKNWQEYSKFPISLHSFSRRSVSTSCISGIYLIAYLHFWHIYWADGRVGRGEGLCDVEPCRLLDQPLRRLDLAPAAALALRLIL